MNAVDKHPQRQEILDALLAGEPLRSIGRRFVPPLNHTSLARYRLQMIQPMIRGTRGKSANALLVKDFKVQKGLCYNSSADTSADYANLLRQRVHDAVDARLERRTHWIKDAEQKVYTDDKGNTIKQMDHRALAAHDGNEHKDIEFLSRLGGLLQDGAGNVTINLAVVAGGSGAQAAEPVVIELSKSR